MRAFGARLSQVVGSAIILGFFSEFFFLNEGPVRNLLAASAQNPFVVLAGLAELVAYYGLFTYPFLIALGHFRVASWPGLILAAGLYGLAAEALVVPVVYEAPPWSFFWTSLSWHTLIDVVVGWYLMRVAMRGPLGIAIAAPVALGVIWGLWSTWFWSENPDALLSLPEFTLFASLTGLFLILGTWLADRTPVSQFRAGRIEILVISGITVVLMISMGAAYLLSMLALVIAVGVILWALRAQTGRGATLFLSRLDTKPHPSRYLLLVLVPLVATASYGLVLRTGFQLPSEAVVLSLLAAGMASFLWALGAALWPRRIRQA